MRHSIFFYDWRDWALPRAVSDLQHKPVTSRRDVYFRDSTAPHPDRLPFAMPRVVIIPAGSWPRRMPAELAAGYCGEPTVEAFLKRVGSEYPQPRITEGRRRLWLRDDLDQAILPPDLQRVRDVAEDL
jgi:hypothetical protein